MTVIGVLFKAAHQPTDADDRPHNFPARALRLEETLIFPFIPFIQFVQDFPAFSQFTASKITEFIAYELPSSPGYFIVRQ